MQLRNSGDKSFHTITCTAKYKGVMDGGQHEIPSHIFLLWVEVRGKRPHVSFFMTPSPFSQLLVSTGFLLVFHMPEISLSK